MYEMEDNVEEIGSRLGRQVARMRVGVVEEQLEEFQARTGRLEAEVETLEEALLGVELEVKRKQRETDVEVERMQKRDGMVE